MNTPLASTAPPSALVHPSIHPDERAAREELAACYRIFDMLGWAEMIYNHITVRLPDSVTGGEKQFLINPFGLHYSEVTAGNLLKIDLQGNKLDANVVAGEPRRLHGARRHPRRPARRALRDAHAHHGRPGRGLHCRAAWRRTTSIRRSCTAWWRTTTSRASPSMPTRRPRLLKNIGKAAVILRNHGLLAWGGTLPLAFVRLWTLQRACEIQVAQASRWARPFPKR
jgi:hypothetical protein